MLRMEHNRTPLDNVDRDDQKRPRGIALKRTYLWTLREAEAHATDRTSWRHRIAVHATA